MPTKWSDIARSDEYKTLGSQEQIQLRQRYYNNVISVSDDFGKLNDADKLNLTERFFKQTSTTAATPGGIESFPVGPEEMERVSRIQFENEFNDEEFKRKTQLNAILKLPSAGKNAELSRLDPVQLLAAASDLNPVTDFGDRRKVIQLLVSKGIPLDAINDFVLADNPETLMKQIVGEIPETGGEIIGGLIGAKVGKPIRGAAIGRAAGSLVEDILQRIFITERQKTVFQDTTDISFDAAEGLISEWASRKVIATVGKLLKPGGKSKKFGIDEIREGLEEAGKRVTIKDIPEEIGELAALKPGGVGLATAPVIPPGAVTQSKFFALMDNVSEKAVTSMQRIHGTRVGANIPAFMKQTDDILESFADDLIKQLSPAELGVFLDSVIQGGDGALEAARGIYRPFYQRLDDLTKATVKKITEDVSVPTGLLDQFGQPVTRTVKRVVGEAMEGGVSNKKAKAIAKKLTDLVKKGRLLRGADESAAFIENVSNLAGNSTFTEGITNRSVVLELARKFDDAGDRGAARLARELSTAMDEAMEIAAKKHGPAAHKLWRRANQTFAAVQERFAPKVITQLAKEAAENPEMAVKTIFKDKQPTRILRVRKILLSPSGKTAGQIADGKQTWKSLKQAYVTQIINSTKSTDGIVFGQNLLSRLDDMGEDALRAIFSPDEIKRLRLLGRTGKLIQGKIKGEGGMLIQLLQPSAAAGVIAGEGKTRLASLAILSVPPVWSRMATDPKWNKFLIDGLIDINTKGINASTSAITKLLKGYFQVRREYLAEQKKVQQKKLRRRQEAALEDLRRRGGRVGE